MSSGTSGNGMKALCIPWRSFANFAESGRHIFDLHIGTRWAEFNHPAYDLSMTNLLLAVTSGASIYPATRLAERLRPASFLAQHGITHLRTVPKVLHFFRESREFDHAHLAAVQLWAFGGDLLVQADVLDLLKLGIPEIMNTFGTSETVGFNSWATFRSHEDVIAEQGIVPIGEPVPGWSIDVVGGLETGPIEISSKWLPEGYWIAPESDQARFKLFSDGNKCFITSDVGLRVGNRLYCMGRKGRIAKVNGHLVNPALLDTCLVNSLNVEVYSVVVSGIMHSFLAEPEGRIDERAISRVLTGVLPHYYWPRMLHHISQLPVNTSGKVDEERLLAFLQEGYGESDQG